MSAEPLPAEDDSVPERPAAADVEIASELGRGLSQLFRVAGRAKSRMLTTGTGIEWSTFVVLIPLVESGPLRSSALAEAVHLDPSRVSRMISHVIELGLVARRADPADGRAAILEITPKGQRVFDQLARQRDEYLATVLEGWSAHDRRTLARLMCRLARDFSDSLHHADPKPQHASPHHPPATSSKPSSKLEHA